MIANILCKEQRWTVQGYLYRGFSFVYTCPNCRSRCSGEYCSHCGTKIEYAPKPKNFELHDFQGEWYVSEERKES